MSAAVLLLALPNVSAPCVTLNPCTCPVYGPGGAYLPVQNPDGSWLCALALEAPGPVVFVTPVPTLAEWAVLATVVLIAVTGWRQLR